MSDEGEIVWRPSGKVFLKRALLSSVITAMALNGFGLLTGITNLDLAGLVAAVISLAVSAAFYLIVFDEWQNWNRHRGDEWRLTAHSLGYRNLDDAMSFSDLPLSEIKSIRHGFWRGVRIRMTDGRAFVMSYLADSKQVKQQIANQMAATHGELVA